MKLLVGVAGVAAGALAAHVNPLERRKTPREAVAVKSVKCVGVEGFEEHWAHCDTPHCDLFTEFCRVVEDGEAAPTTTTTTTTKPSVDCAPYADGHTIPADVLDDGCAKELVARTCTAVLQAGCSDAACVEEHLNALYALIGTGPAPTTTTTTTTTKGAVDPPPPTDLDCDAMAAKGSIPAISANCSDALIKSLCVKYAAECSDDATCVEGKLKTKVESLDGTWDGDSSQPAPTTTTTTTTTTTKSGGDPDDVPFARNISPRDIVVASPWGIENYNGLSGYRAAEMIHAQITEAIRDGPAEFKKFCGTGDLDADRRECAAFFSNVAKETGGLTVFEEDTASTYCTHRGDGDEGLQAAGKEWPCCVQDDRATVCGDMGSCPFGCNMHGRGAIQLTWNFNYGRFSEFYYGDRDVLLQKPDMVEPRGVMGWAASIWFWMTSQDYGGACPPEAYNDSLPMGHMSCHDAMHTADGGGFGQTIRIINGGYEACKTSPGEPQKSAHYRIGYFFQMCADWGIPAAPHCEFADPLCDVSGKEQFEATDGVVGNPQIAYPQSPDCPNCRLPGCQLTVADKWSICGSPASSECPDPIPNFHTYACV